MKLNISAAVVAASVSVSVAASAQQAPLPPIWFHSQSPIGDNNAPGVGADFMHLWDTPNTGWPHGASGTQVYMFSTEWIARASAADLTTAFAWLRANNMKAGLISEGALPPDPSGCSSGWPSFHADNNNSVIKAVTGIGEKIDIIDFDEPMINGHYLASSPKKTGTGCQYTIDTLVSKMVPAVQQFQAAFPGVSIGDTEPFANFPVSTYVADIRRFKADWHADIGSYIPFMIDDIQWGVPGGPDWTFLTNLEATVHPAHFGMSFDGLGENGVNSDSNWVQTCFMNMQAYTTNMPPPDIAMILSFQNWPTLALPETNGARLTATIVYYMGLFGR